MSVVGLPFLILKPVGCILPPPWQGRGENAECINGNTNQSKPIGTGKPKAVADVSWPELL
jgi:hypothetical protein